MMESLIKQATTWIEDQITQYPFAEISIKLIIHDGIIKRIEKTICEKEQIIK